MTATLDTPATSSSASGWRVAPSVASKMNELASASIQARHDVNNWFTDVMCNCRQILGMNDVPSDLLKSLGADDTNA